MATSNLAAKKKAASKRKAAKKATDVDKRQKSPSRKKTAKSKSVTKRKSSTRSNAKKAGSRGASQAASSKKKRSKAGKKSVQKTKKKSNRPTVASLLTRIEKLERALADAQSGLRPRGWRRSAARAASIARVEFEKGAGSPDLTRLSVEGTEVFGPGGAKGGLDAPVGEWIVATIETNGNPGDRVTVSVKRGAPSTLVLEIPEHTTQTFGHYPILVTG